LINYKKKFMNYFSKQALWTNKNQPIFNKLGKLPGFLVVILITTYQWTLSPDHGIFSIYNTGVCKHRPTCSEFTKDAVKRLGARKGLVVGFGQIKKCY